MATRMGSLVENNMARPGGIEVVDDLTVRINLASPDIALMVSVADYPAAVVHSSFTGDDPVAPLPEEPEFPGSTDDGTTLDVPPSGPRVDAGVERDTTDSVTSGKPDVGDDTAADTTGADDDTRGAGDSNGVEKDDEDPPEPPRLAPTTIKEKLKRLQRRCAEHRFPFKKDVKVSVRVKPSGEAYDIVIKGINEETPLFGCIHDEVEKLRFPGTRAGQPDRTSQILTLPAL